MPQSSESRPTFTLPRFLAWFAAGTVIAGCPISLLAWFYFLAETRWTHSAFVLPLAFGVAASEVSLLRAPWVRRSLVAGMSLIAVLAWATIGLTYWRWTLGAQQIQNLELLRAYGRILEGYKNTYGEYPDTLPQALPLVIYGKVVPGYDWWGYPVKYESKQGAYVLVSPGRGGLFDSTDPWQLRQRYAAAHQMISICGEWSADHVLSDLGVVQGCGK